jgi:glyoxylase-like metal-dependent hydrolase (beta-lactamase superfamily II)
VRAEPVATIGDVVITRVGEIESARAPEAFFDDDASDVRRALSEQRWLADWCTDDGKLRLSFQAFVVETPDTVILVDPCIGNDRASFLFPEPLHTTFLEDLAEAVGGLAHIDVVAFTHLHFDHIGWSTIRTDDVWAPTFPWARYVIAGTDWDHWRSVTERGPESDFTRAIDESIRPLFEHDVVQLVDSDHQLAAGVRLRNTSGHSPGHVSIDIESNGQRALITGDVIHHPVQVHDPRFRARVGVDDDRDRALGVRVGLVEELTDTGTLMVGTHFAGCCAGHVERDEHGSRRFRANR